MMWSPFRSHERTQPLVGLLGETVVEEQAPVELCHLARCGDVIHIVKDVERRRLVVVLEAIEIRERSIDGVRIEAGTGCPHLLHDRALRGAS